MDSKLDKAELAEMKLNEAFMKHELYLLEQMQMMQRGGSPGANL